MFSILIFDTLVIIEEPKVLQAKVELVNYLCGTTAGFIILMLQVVFKVLTAFMVSSDSSSSYCSIVALMALVVVVVLIVAAILVVLMILTIYIAVRTVLMVPAVLIYGSSDSYMVLC